MDEEFDNELSSDDSDYQPEKNKHVESDSEGSIANNDDPETSDEEKTKKSKKQKRSKLSFDEEERKLDPEEEKRKENELWDLFMSGSEVPLHSKENSSDSGKPKSSTITLAAKKQAAPTTSKSIPAAAPTVFEFAGETIEVPAKEETEESVAPAAASGPAKRSGGGLGSVLNQLAGKKSKLSVLEKTKMDWDGFKSNEGINEELQTHNRGRDGFLERKDFLNRTDLRQFEIEKSLRLSRRK